MDMGGGMLRKGRTGMDNRREGDKNRQNCAEVLFGWPLTSVTIHCRTVV